MHLSKEYGAKLAGDNYEDPNQSNPMMRVKKVYARGHPCTSVDYYTPDRIYNIQFELSDGVRSQMTPKHGSIDCDKVEEWEVPDGEYVS